MIDTDTGWTQDELAMLPAQWLDAVQRFHHTRGRAYQTNDVVLRGIANDASVGLRDGARGLGLI